MIIFLILGAILGVVSVVFVLQNITPVTVTFLAWQLDGSLALMLFLAMMSGIIVTLLFLLPSFIRDEFLFSRLKKRAQALEGELAQVKAERPAPAKPIETPVE